MECIISLYIVPFLVVLVNTQSNFFGEFLDAHNACQKDPSTRIVGNLMDMAVAGQPVDQIALGNHILCMYLRLRIMCRNGRVNPARTIDLLTDVLNDRPAVSRAVNRCYGSRRPYETHQQVAIAWNLCVSRSLPSLSTVTPPV